MNHHSLRIADPVKFRLAEQLADILNAMSPVPQSPALTAGELASMITRPPEPEMGDYALPCFRFAKSFRKNPAEIASGLAAALRDQSFEGRAMIAELLPQQAFLNIRLDVRELAKMLLPRILDGSWFSALKEESQPEWRRVMIEYSQPNTHKEFHIGHGRNLSLGDSVARIFAYTGHQVIPVNYIGDEGTHVAKCLWQTQKDLARGDAAPVRDFTSWYGRRYAEANRYLQEASPEEKKLYQKEISAVLAQLEARSGPFFELWKKSREECLQDFHRIYEWFGAWFEHDFFESEVSEASQQIVDEFISKGLFSESEGAYGLNLESEGLGYFMARKSDGSSLYITKDLALARKKFDEYEIDRSVYVVGCEQNFHFRQLFSVLKKMGFAQASRCYHLSYAHVSLPDGKMSSRRGNVRTMMSLVDMVRGGIDAHLGKYEGVWSPEEIRDVGEKLTVAAIRYGMLASDPQKEIVFDPDAWTSFEGNSGPYLLYCYSRVRSVLRECEKRGFESSEQHLELLNSPWESELLNAMYDFNLQVLNACEYYRPSTLAGYLFNLCKSFNRFYANAPVMNAGSQELRSARMALLAAFGNVLKQGLALLGIEPAERM